MEDQNSGICDFREPANSEINPDRISDLPEALLIRILSLLDMRDAVKTGILCKRWENLWTHVDNLDYTYECDTIEPNELQLENFISFVERTLMLSTRPIITKFTFYACYSDFFDDANYAHQVVDKLLQRIFEKNVKSFEFQITGFCYRPPEWFYNNSSFVKLDLNDWEIKILGQSVNWTSLKTLYLSHVAIDGENILKILSGCPILETLLLNEVSGNELLDSTSLSLRRVKVFQSNNSDDLLAILLSPGLQVLELSGYFYSRIPRLVGPSSLIAVTLNLSCMKVVGDAELLLRMACRILENIHYVEELKLGKLFIQALSITKLLWIPSPLFKCKHLTVDCSISKYELPGIACLLQSAPDLETLVIEVENPEKHNFEKYLDGILDIKEDEYLSMQIGEFPNLKNIEVEHYCRSACSLDEARNDVEKFFDYELVAYILMNARVKEKLVITSRYCKWQYASLLAHKLKSNLEFDEEFEFRQNQTSFEFNFCHKL